MAATSRDLLESFDSWIIRQEALDLGIQTRQIRSGMLQLIAENTQTNRSSGEGAPTAPTLFGQSRQLPGGRTAIMRWDLAHATVGKGLQRLPRPRPGRL
jgi:hypothetical protein